MQVALDLQACQSASKFRGIGHYSFPFALTFIKLLESRGHEPIVILNSALNYTSDLRAQIKSLFPSIKVYCFNVLTNSAAGIHENQWRLRASELLREYAIGLLMLDFLHISTLIADGWEDNCIASVGSLPFKLPTAITHYDLVPLVMQFDYLPPGHFRAHYFRRLESLRNADLLLAISNYSRLEAIELLDCDESQVVSIFAAIEKQSLDDAYDVNYIFNNLNLPGGYVFCAPGGWDIRKNLNNLIKAYSLLNKDFRFKHPLVIGSNIPKESIVYMQKLLSELDISSKEIVFTGFLPEKKLQSLYALCHAYICPSTYEGFGLPLLEAMQYGVPVIGSNATSIPEVIELSEALFDPFSIVDMKNAIERVCIDEDFRKILISNSHKQANKYSWERTAGLALGAIENRFCGLLNDGHKKANISQALSFKDLRKMLEKDFDGVGPSAEDWSEFEKCFDENFIEFTK